MAVFQQRDLGINIIDRIHHKLRLALPRALPSAQQRLRAPRIKLLRAQVKPHPRRDLRQPALQALDLGQADVGERRHRVPVQARQRDLVEVDQPQRRDAGARQRRGRMRAHAAAADDDDERGAQAVEAVGGEEHAVARELLEDQFRVEVAGLGAAREGFGAEVVFVWGGDCAEGGELVRWVGAVSYQRFSS